MSLIQIAKVMYVICISTVFNIDKQQIIIIIIMIISIMTYGMNGSSNPLGNYCYGEADSRVCALRRIRPGLRSKDGYEINVQDFSFYFFPGVYV